MKDVIVDNNDKWNSKVNQAINYITEIEDEYEQTFNSVSKELESFTIRQELLQKAYEDSSEYNHTSQLFSPYQNNESKRVKEKISEDLTQIKTQIEEFLKKINEIKSAREAYINVLDCLQYTKEILKQNMENNVNNNSIISNVLDAQEFERQRIANDLHDVSIQGMANLVHKTELCIKLIDLDSERAKIEMKVIVNQVRELISGVRKIVYNLRPDTIRDLGLVATLNRFLAEYSKNYHIQTTFHSNDEVESLPESIKISLYRIIQEACNNISKHSHADLCKINLEYNKNKIQLTIEDNGCGLKLQSKCNNTDYSGLGISIMKDRVTLLGGSFCIDPHVSRGTLITVCIPYSK